METLDLNATVRTTTGNGPARALRRNGQIPAVVYGRNTDTTMLAIDAHDLELAMKNRNVNQMLLNLIIDQKKSKKRAVMIKELQKNPLGSEIFHVDFYEIDMQRKIRVNIPIVTTGKSVGIERGGLLQVVRRELEVLCLPGEIPESFEIDISDLDIGDSVHVEEIPVAEGVEILYDVNFTVVTIISPTIEIEEEVEVEEEEEEEAEVEAEASDAEEEE